MMRIFFHSINNKCVIFNSYVEGVYPHTGEYVTIRDIHYEVESTEWEFDSENRPFIKVWLKEAS
jgi:hypothetical protein